MPQRPGFNYDEANVPHYTLPDPLRFESGQPIADAQQWPRRREELRALFESRVYGRWLPAPPALRFELVDHDTNALDGQAVRKQINVHFTDQNDGPHMELLLYAPRHTTEPAPAFVGLSFFGNHAAHPDPNIRLSTRWMRAPGVGVENHRATEASRGAQQSRWPIDRIINRGYALATLYYGDLALDNTDLYRNDALSLFQNTAQPRGSDDAGAIGAWAWGLSRAMDYFETDDTIDHRRVAVIGHSRLGKAALWAGANDRRFAITISNNSGCGGAALSRRRFGETVARINKTFPHWFCENFKQYGEREDDLPIDQHELIALMAPRPVYVASAEDDGWADPRGEFLALHAAAPVYRLLNAGDLPAREMPSVGQHTHGTLGYHIRPGSHGITETDWAHYLDFADSRYARTHHDKSHVEAS